MFLPCSQLSFPASPLHPHQCSWSLPEPITLWTRSFRYSMGAGCNVLIPNTLIWRYLTLHSYYNVLKPQHKCNTAIAIYSWIAIQTWLPLPVSTCTQPQCCTFPVAMKEQMGWSQLKSVLFKTHFWWLFTFYTPCCAELHIHFPQAGLAGSRRYFLLTILGNLGHLHNQLIHPTDRADYLQQWSSSGPLGLR